jgi:hypothetical protein
LLGTKLLRAKPAPNVLCARGTGRIKTTRTLLLVNVLNVRARHANMWNQREAARICDHKAGSHRKDIERTSNDTMDPWPDGSNLDVAQTMHIEQFALCAYLRMNVERCMP